MPLDQVNALPLYKSNGDPSAQKENETTFLENVFWLGKMLY